VTSPDILTKCFLIAFRRGSTPWIYPGTSCSEGPGVARAVEFEGAQSSSADAASLQSSKVCMDRISRHVNWNGEWPQSEVVARLAITEKNGTKALVIESDSGQLHQPFCCIRDQRWYWQSPFKIHPNRISRRIYKGSVVVLGKAFQNVHKPHHRTLGLGCKMTPQHADDSLGHQSNKNGHE